MSFTEDDPLPAQPINGRVKHNAHESSAEEVARYEIAYNTFRRTGKWPEGTERASYSWCDESLRGDYSDQARNWRQISCEACWEAMHDPAKAKRMSTPPKREEIWRLMAMLNPETEA